MKRPTGLYISVTICAISFLGAGWSIYKYFDQKELTETETNAEIRVDAERKLFKAAKELDDKMADLKKVGDTLAGILERSRIPMGKKRFEPFAHKYINADNKIYSIALIYHPFKYRKNKRLYAPVWYVNNSKIDHKQAEDSYLYDTDRIKGRWYQQAKQGQRWVAQYGNVVDDFAIVYIRPFYGNGKELGFIMVTTTYDWLYDTIRALDIGSGRNAVVTTKQETLLFHPDPALFKDERPLSTIAVKNGDNFLAKLAENSRKTQNLCGNGKTTSDSGSGDRELIWILSCRLKVTSWNFQVLVNKSEINTTESPLKYSMLSIGYIVVGLIFAAAIYLYLRRERLGWSLSFACFVIFLIGTIIAWVFVYNHAEVSEQADRIHNMSSLNKNKFLLDYKETRKDPGTGKELPRFVPTGVHIQAIEFSASNHMIVTGYIWQQYSVKDHGDLEPDERGFVLPDALNKVQYKIKDKQYYQEFKKNGQTIKVYGWQFKAVLRQNFDFSRYPFDRQHAEMRIGYAELHRNVVLIPAPNMFSGTQINRLPGLRPGLGVSSFELGSTYFTYRPNKDATDLGLGKKKFRKDFQELYFNIQVKRKLLNPLVRHLFPITVMAAILFMVLAATSELVTKMNLFGSHLVNTVVSCAGIFFVAVSSHISLRAQLNSDSLVYLETFYILLYLAIPSITVVAFLKVSNEIFEDEINLKAWIESFDLAKYRPAKLFAPLFFGLAFFVTLYTFYS